MNLLLTNDDGIFAAGLHALAMELRKEHTLLIVAPDAQRSGAGHSFTCSAPLRLREISLSNLSGVPAYSLTGTPVDCVKLGCHNLGFEVDMVISGINHGANLGSDVLYSGTVGAAMEGALLGKPAIAVSNYALQPNDFSAAAWAARKAVTYLSAHPLPAGRLLNVNAPDCAVSDLKGVKAAPLCRQEYEQQYTEFLAPTGGRYFFVPNGKLTAIGPDDDSDERWVQNGYVALTPLTFDLTDRALLSGLSLHDFSLSSES